MIFCRSRNYVLLKMLCCNEERAPVNDRRPFLLLVRVVL